MTGRPRRDANRWLLPSLVWVVVAGLVALVALVVADAGGMHTGTTVLALVLASAMVLTGFLIANDADRGWLPVLITVAFGFKLVASALKYWVLVNIYARSGDAVGYHGHGLVAADEWRRFQIPDISLGGAGTTFTAKATGLTYAPFEPTMLGGFFLFATIAFLGQLLFYVAYRRAMPRERLRSYAVAVLCLPSLLFWPASIGKDALMVLFLGVAAYGAARIFERYELRWALLMFVGLVAAAGIRPHVSAILGGATCLALLIARQPEVRLGQTRRWAMILAGTVGAIVMASVASSQLGISIGGDGFDPLVDELRDRTQQGGSAIDAEAVTSISSLPAATIRVLFGPLPFDAHNLQARLSSVESTLMLALIIWRLPWILRNLRHVRRYPYLITSIAFTVGFVVVFSSILNFGIIARQRSQVLPFLLVVIVSMGWSLPESTPEKSAAVGAAPREKIGAES